MLYEEKHALVIVLVSSKIVIFEVQECQGLVILQDVGKRSSSLALKLVSFTFDLPNCIVDQHHSTDLSTNFIFNLFSINTEAV